MGNHAHGEPRVPSPTASRKSERDLSGDESETREGSIEFSDTFPE